MKVYSVPLDRPQNCIVRCISTAAGESWENVGLPSERDEAVEEEEEAEDAEEIMDGAGSQGALSCAFCPTSMV